MAMPDERPQMLNDLYLFACGTQFRECLADFAALSGPLPMPPQSALGNMYSHYQAYSADDVLDIVRNYSALGLPLSHVNLDVDWHRRITDGQRCQGYNGYAWNNSLFPDPTAFLNTLQRQHGLRVGVNTHAFIGVDSCNAPSSCYQAVANATGQAPGLLVPYNLSNLAQQRAVFSACLAPIGADYIWTDGGLVRWVGRGDAGPWNLFFDTHLHDTAMAARGARPIVMPRFSGLGQHRYPVGFSGDADSTWTTLQAEVRRRRKKGKGMKEKRKKEEEEGKKERERRRG